MNQSAPGSGRHTPPIRVHLRRVMPAIMLWNDNPGGW